MHRSFIPAVALWLLAPACAVDPSPPVEAARTNATTADFVTPCDVARVNAEHEDDIECPDGVPALRPAADQEGVQNDSRSRSAWVFVASRSDLRSGS